MAYGLTCQCEKCGYAVPGIEFGAFRTPGICRMPVFNKASNTVDCINISENIPGYGTTLIPYTDKSLKSFFRTLFHGKRFSDWNSHINAHHNYCPQCKSYNLSFGLNYLVD